MTGPEAIKELNVLRDMSKGDPEAAHSMADKILCKLLTDLGYSEVVQAFSEVDRWYA